MHELGIFGAERLRDCQLTREEYYLRRASTWPHGNCVRTEVCLGPARDDLPLVGDVKSTPQPRESAIISRREAGLRTTHDTQTIDSLTATESYLRDPDEGSSMKDR